MPSKKVPYIPHLDVITGSEEFHLVAGVVRDGGGNVTNVGNSRHVSVADLATFIIAEVPAGFTQAAADGRYLQKTNNLSDVASPATARNNLGLGSAATYAVGALLQSANNLSDVASPATARNNLGLGSAATFASGGFLQPGNNLSDIGNAATARANLGITSGGNWYAGHFPTAAILGTVITAGAAVAPTITDDASVGMLFDGGASATGENFNVRYQAAPANTASWAATAHICPNLPNANFHGFGIALGTTDANKWTSMLLAMYATGTYIQERRAYSGGFLASDFQFNVENTNEPIWLRIRWDQPSATYFYDMSRDGKLWRNLGTRTISTLGFTPDHVGLCCSFSDATAANHSMGSCDYWVVG